MTGRNNAAAHLSVRPDVRRLNGCIPPLPDHRLGQLTLCQSAGLINGELSGGRRVEIKNAPGSAF